MYVKCMLSGYQKLIQTMAKGVIITPKKALGEFFFMTKMVYYILKEFHTLKRSG